jgi:DNA polymerase-3 subunit delta'
MQFKDVVGQKDVIKHLVHIAQTGNIPHAQLFLEFPGSGGLALALAFANYIMCENPQEEDACGVCPSCQKNKKFIHPDLHFVYPVIRKKPEKPSLSSDYIKEWRDVIIENPYVSSYDWLQAIKAENKQGKITADETRRIIQTLQLKSFESKYKVLIIWQPEALGIEGNILLKLIEEPTDDTIILLVSANLQQILTTIVSRTQIVKINPIDDESLFQELKTKFPNIGDTEIQTAVNLSEGNFREAYSSLMSTENNLFNYFSEWIPTILKTQLPQMVSWVNETSGIGRENIKKLLDYTVHIIRQSTLQYFSENQLPSKLNKQELLFLEKYPFKIENTETFNALVECIEKSNYQIERNGNPKIVLLSLSLEIRQLLKQK